MSWITKVLGGIGHELKVVAGVVTSPVATAIEKNIPLIGGFVALINPVVAKVINKVDATVNGVEALITTAQAGAAKKQTVAQILEAELPNLQEIIAEFGSGVKIPQAETDALIEAVVGVYKASEAFYAALKPPPPTQ